jgi:hypothetical protein
MYMHLSRIQNPVRVDHHHYKGTIGAEGSPFRQNIEVARELEGFLVNLNVKVNDVWIHKSEFTAQEKAEWAAMESKAFREHSDLIEGDRLDAVRAIKEYGVWSD